MIVVTGAAGFIGSCLVGKLNTKGFNQIIIVDDFSDQEKLKNLENKEYHKQVHRDHFIEWFEKNSKMVTFVIHLGAITDTTETNISLLESLNVNYSKSLWEICAKKKIPFIYASSAATYGMGESGFNDDEEKLKYLQPLNPYGYSKHKFDLWAIEQKQSPPYWVGMKFFNVYGPNEYHKGNMASVVLHAYYQINNTGKVKLFKSYRSEFKDGWQLRDFIYIKDLLNVICHFINNCADSGIYNIGTGLARSFNDLTKAIFKSMNLPENIEFIEMPKEIQSNYQYMTEANIKKLIKAGYNRPFYTVEMGVREYIQGYLYRNSYY